jgi:hypothetical protein
VQIAIDGSKRAQPRLENCGIRGEMQFCVRVLCRQVLGIRIDRRSAGFGGMHLELIKSQSQLPSTLPNTCLNNPIFDDSVQDNC